MAKALKAAAQTVEEKSAHRSGRGFAGFKQTAAALSAVLLLALTAPQAQAFDFFGLFGSDKEEEVDAQAARDLEAVKNGVLSQYSTTVRLGPGLEHYFDCMEGSAAWSHSVSKRSERVVSFTCTLKNFKDELANLGFLQNISTFSAGINAFLQNPEKGTDNLKEAQELSKKAVDELRSVDLKVDFVMNVDVEDRFEPLQVALGLNYPGGSEDYELKLERLADILKDDKIFNLHDEDILALIASLPAIYQRSVPEHAQGEVI